MPEPIICDTSVWLYTGRVGHIDLLSHLYSPVYATEAVCLELDAGRMIRADTPDVRELPWVHVVQPNSQAYATLPVNRLGPGEQSVLAYAHAQQLNVVGLDDRQARDLAQRMGLRALGTIGLFLKAKEAGLVPSVRSLLVALQKEGFYIGQGLIEYALHRAQE